MGYALLVILAGAEIALALFMFVCSWTLFSNGPFGRELVGGALGLGMGLALLVAAVLGLVLGAGG